MINNENVNKMRKYTKGIFISGFKIMYFEIVMDLK